MGQRIRTSNIVAFIFLFVLVSGPGAFAQQNSEPVIYKNKLVSPVDEGLTISKITVLPVSDNINGIYARPFESKLIDLVKASHRFEWVESKADPVNLDELEEKPELARALGKKMGVDAFLASKIFKSPRKTEVTLSLYLTSDGLPLAQETQSLEAKAEVRLIQKAATDLYAKMLEKIPYRGMVLSRTGNRVTVDLGTLDGIKPNQVLTVHQVIALNRHPKFKFVLSTEKEIIGKIRVLKPEETLSFGVIIQEREPGVIDKQAKISNTEFVNYTDDGQGVQGPLGTMQPAGNPNNVVSFGKNPKEWLPENAPTFGRLQMGLGLGSLQRSDTTALSGTKEGKVPIFPSIELRGELWLTPNWYVGAMTRQGIFSMDNPNGSSPSSLSSTLTSYEFRGGYRFLLQDDFFGPQVSLHGGIQKFSMFVDASTPLTFTSTSFYGFFLGVAGSLPISSDRRWYLDVELNRFFYPVMTETPVTSASNVDASITQFAFGASYRLTNRFFITGHLDMGFYSATFTGSGTRQVAGVPDPGLNMSERVTQLIGGLIYMF